MRQRGTERQRETEKQKTEGEKETGRDTENKKKEDTHTHTHKRRDIYNMCTNSNTSYCVLHSLTCSNSTTN